MQNGALFGLIDFLTRQHALDGARKTGFFGQLEEKFKRFACDAVLGAVDEDVMEAKGKRVEARRIILEKIRNAGVFYFLEVLSQSQPASGLNRIDLTQHTGFLLFFRLPST